MKPLSECRLYTFVDTAYLRGRSPQSVTRSLCDGGSDLIQLRAKDSALDEIGEMAGAILPITTRAGVYLVINDHPQLAAETGAPLCHLGQEDFFDAGYRHTSELRTCHPQLQIGLSTHNPAQAERAIGLDRAHELVGDATKRIQLEWLLARPRFEELIEALLEVDRRSARHVIKVVALAVP